MPGDKRGINFVCRVFMECTQVGDEKGKSVGRCLTYPGGIIPGKAVLVVLE